MEIASQFGPSYLYAVGAMLFLAAFLGAWKVPVRWRIPWVIVWLVPALGLLMMAQHLAKTRREIERQSQAIFVRITPNAELCETEIATLRVLATNTPAVQEEVMRLAFANADNAITALPRLELLLHCVLQSDTTGQKRESLWQKVVTPAMRKNPSREVILLAAAMTSVGGYDRSKAETILPQLYPLFATETNSGMRVLPLGTFAHLAEFAPGEELEKAAGFLLPEMLGESAPLAFQTFLPAADPVPTRKFDELYRVTSHLSGPAADRFADEILRAMTRSTNISQTIALGKLLSMMKTNLNPAQIDLAAANLASRWPEDADFAWQRGRLLASFATVMTSNQASNCVCSVLADIEAYPNWWRELPPEPCKTLATRLDNAALHRLAVPMVRSTPVLMETLRDRLSEAEAGELWGQMLQTMLDTPVATKRSTLIQGLQLLAFRLGPETAGKLTDQLWDLYLRGQDGYRRNDAAYCLVALFPRISDQQAAKVAKMVVKEMQQPGSNLPVLTAILNPLLGRCDPATVKEAAACLMAFPNRQPAGKELNEFMLGARLTPAQIKTMTEPLVKGLENIDNLGSSVSYVKSLAPLTAQLDAGQMKRVAGCVVFLYTQRLGGRDAGKYYEYLDTLTTNLIIEPKQAGRIQDIMLPEALYGKSHGRSPFACTVGFLVRSMNSGDAEATGKFIISTMGRSVNLKNGEPFKSYGDYLNALESMQDGTQCLIAIAGSLQPDQAGRLGEELLTMATNHWNSTGLVALLNKNTLPTPGGWQMPWEFIEHQETVYDNYVLGCWSQSVEAMVLRMNKDDSEKIANQAAARLAQQADLGPLAYDEHTTKLLQHASVVALKEILSKPCALGGLRQMVLRAWELKTGKAFQDEIWKLSDAGTRAATL